MLVFQALFRQNKPKSVFLALDNGLMKASSFGETGTVQPTYPNSEVDNA